MEYAVWALLVVMGAIIVALLYSRVTVRPRAAHRHVAIDGRDFDLDRPDQAATLIEKIKTIPLREKHRIVIDEPLRSPLSRRRCAYFEAVVEERRSTRNRSSWVEVIREVGSRDFRLRDESGEVTVAVREEDVALTSDVSMSTGFLKDPTPELEAFLASHGQSGTGWIFNRSLRYREGVLGVGGGSGSGPEIGRPVDHRRDRRAPPAGQRRSFRHVRLSRLACETNRGIHFRRQVRIAALHSGRINVGADLRGTEAVKDRARAPRKRRA
jgi:hypothetical protein